MTWYGSNELASSWQIAMYSSSVYHLPMHLTVHLTSDTGRGPHIDFAPCCSYVQWAVKPDS